MLYFLSNKWELKIQRAHVHLKNHSDRISSQISVYWWDMHRDKASVKPDFLMFWETWPKQSFNQNMDKFMGREIQTAEPYVCWYAQAPLTHSSHSYHIYLTLFWVSSLLASLWIHFSLPQFWIFFLCLYASIHEFLFLASRKDICG